MPLIKPHNKKLIVDPAEIGTLDYGDKLDTGMKAEEAIRRATNWWETKGRREAKLQAMRQAEPVGGSNKGNGVAFASMDVDNPNFMPSGIQAGVSWDELTRDEQLRIVKAWHHYFVRSPDEIEVGDDKDESEPIKIVLERVKNDDDE